MSGAYICVVGDALIDELQNPVGVEEHVGGAGLNVAVGLRRLGLDTSLVAMVGEDRAGDDIRAHLATSGVALHATTVPTSARAVSDRRHGEPHYVFTEAARTRRIGFDPQQRSALAGAALVVVSSYPFDDPGQSRALSEAIADAGARVVLDPNPRAGLISDIDAFRAGFESLASRSLLVKIGDEDAQLLYGEPLSAVAHRLLGLGPSAVLATAGPAGASLHLPGGETVHSPVHPLPGPIVDTMGAGDATLASITRSLAGNGLPDTPAAASAALRDAMAIAAATCRVPGALLRLPPAPAAG